MYNMFEKDQKIKSGYPTLKNGKKSDFFNRLHFPNPTRYSKSDNGFGLRGPIYI